MDNHEHKIQNRVATPAAVVACFVLFCAGACACTVQQARLTDIPANKPVIFKDGHVFAPHEREWARSDTEIQRVIYEYEKGGHDSCIDFDTGKTFTLPDHLRDDAKGREIWCLEKGIDAYVCWKDGGVLGLQGVGLSAGQVEQELWRRGHSEAAARARTLKLQEDLFMEYDGLASHFIFRTHEGGLGIVKIINQGPDGGSRYLRLRYKIPSMKGVFITGRVVSEPGGKGVGGVSVVLQTGLGIGLQAKTDEHGSYRFGPVEADKKQRSMDMWLETDSLPAGTWRPGIRLSVADKDVQAGELYLRLPQRISGTVRDLQTGEPAGEGVRMQISKVPCPLDSLVTDANGQYCFYVEPGQYALWCRGSEQRYYESGADRRWTERTKTVTAAPGEWVEGVDFEVLSAAEYSGIVLWPDGQPAKDAEVFACAWWEPIGSRVYIDSHAGPNYSRLRVKTDEQGRFVGYLRRPDVPERGEDESITIQAIARLADGSMGGVSEAKATKEEPPVGVVKVVLARCGSATVRLIGRDREPVEEARVISSCNDGTRHILADHLADLVQHQGQGFYKFGGLIPGLEHQFSFYAEHGYRSAEANVVISKAGEQLDLGTILLEPNLTQ
ncbi:MAG TPA: hypothetical protein VMX13_06265 [Sedimentisphaerales bacterium]|nr:hypothetical protein [Sedimentisphaerales bacterium]